MAATAIDSIILGNLFSTEAMRRVFSDESRLQRYLDVEAALAAVQARLGVIPLAAVAAIERHCSVRDLDLARLRCQTERLGDPVPAVVEQVVEKCPGDLGQHVHWGATTQDITDTATILQIREALALVDDDLQAIVASLADLARRYRDAPMAGRSNLQQAVPITFGYKAAVLLAAIERHRARLAELRPRVLVGEFGGAVGTLAALGPDGLKVRAALMKELGLGEADIAWHTTPDIIAEVACLLGLVAGTLGKIAADVKLLMQTEVGEVFEPFAEGRGVCSTMPQKRDPVSCNVILACTSLVRQHVAAILGGMVEDHERATGSAEIAWIAVPQLFLLSAGALRHAREMLAGLEVDTARMRANLDLTQGLICAEAVMMALAPYLGRQRAHDLVYDICRQAVSTGRPLVDLLAEDKEVAILLDRPTLARLVDPVNYLGAAGELVDRVLAKFAKGQKS
jgi:3-carboxy-cis,cis-muconate cycloisomerase